MSQKSLYETHKVVVKNNSFMMHEYYLRRNEDSVV